MRSLALLPGYFVMLVGSFRAPRETCGWEQIASNKEDVPDFGAPGKRKAGS